MLKRLDKLINEGWVVNVKGIDVFESPNISDLKIIRKSGYLRKNYRDSYRFLINKNSGETYMWDGWSLTHNEVIKDLKLESILYIHGEYGQGNTMGLLELVDFKPFTKEIEVFDDLMKKSNLQNLLNTKSLSLKYILRLKGWGDVMFKFPEDDLTLLIIKLVYGDKPSKKEVNV